MAKIRHLALEIAQNRPRLSVNIPDTRIETYYKELIFDSKAMQQYLSPENFRRFNEAIETGVEISEMLADEIAKAMKAWAITKGATHYTHWFQPLTGGSAEKHDAFFDVSFDGRAIEDFRGKALVRQEPDASSLPNGGIRQTFEARGYTAWDASSPAFIMYNDAGTGTLCIPSIYLSYTGELLDTKTPLLSSIAVLNKAATAVAQIFDRHVTRVVPTLGIEQEYFLVDKALYNARPDLQMAGRTVFGHAPAKGQQMEDHYFGSIPPRVNAFMVDFEFEALRMGIPVKTRHNEVAPAQFEVAPLFEEMNLACDHNILLMDIMKKVAYRHNFQVLFHEKPFAGINGSGKHNNWSMGTDTGVNLLSPSSKPKEGLRFVTFLVNVIKAVHDYADILRASIASAGNEYRLGGNEAPPAIISIFLGQELMRVLKDIEEKEVVKVEKGENAYLKLGLNNIPSILLDTTDRNRTSPFAFTGNKFEYRAVGSSANSATPMMVLNTIVANQLKQFKADYDAERVADDSKKEGIIVKILKRYIKESKNIIFEGNGYSEEWEQEAARRGLNNEKSAVKAFEFYLAPKAIQLFVNTGIFTEREIRARYEVELENYVKKVQIESRVVGDLAINHVVSTAIKYQTNLVKNARDLRDIGLQEQAEPIIGLVKEISMRIEEITRMVEEMTEARRVANNIDEIEERSHHYSTYVKDYFEKIRYHVDKLELIIDDEDWPLVKYREMFYSHQ